MSDVLAMILESDVGTARVYTNNSAPRPWLVKHVLLVIAMHRDEVQTMRGIAEFIGCSLTSVDRCIAVLLREGLMTGELWQNKGHGRGGSAGTVYTLNLPAIQALPRVARRATA